MRSIKSFLYSLLLEYHFNTAKKFKEYDVAYRYHNQKGKHYYKLTHGREYKD